MKADIGLAIILLVIVSGCVADKYVTGMIKIEAKKLEYRQDK